MKGDLIIEVTIKEKGRVLSSQVGEYDNNIFGYYNGFITYLPQFVQDVGNKACTEVKNKLKGRL